MGIRNGAFRVYRKIEGYVVAGRGVALRAESYAVAEALVASCRRAFEAGALDSYLTSCTDRVIEVTGVEGC